MPCGRVACRTIPGANNAGAAVGGTCATLAQQQVIIAPAITERDTQNAAFMSPPFLPAERLDSASGAAMISPLATRVTAASLQSFVRRLSW